MAIWKKKRERVLFRLLAAVLSCKNVRCIYQRNVILFVINWIVGLLMLQLILLINYFSKIFFCLVFVGLLKVTVELYIVYRTARLYQNL